MYKWITSSYNILIVCFLLCQTFSLRANTLWGIAADSCPTLLNPVSIGAVCEVSLGYASITAVGIDTPFTYSWTFTGTEDVVSTDSEATDLVPGNYELVVTNAMGNCSDTMLFNIPLLNVPQVSITGVWPEHCGQLNGSASLSVVGGTSPYIIHWFPVNNPGDTIAQGANATQMPAGTYLVQVYNQDGTCMQQLFVTIPAIREPNIQAINLINADCELGNGAIIVAVSGGGGPYQFTWYNTTHPDIPISSDSILQNVVAGTYTVEVSNANGQCTQTATFTVQNSGGPQLGSLQAVASGCGLSNGSASVTLSGGNAPYITTWINPANGDTLGTGTSVDDLAPGTYYLVAANADSSCSFLTGFTIVETGSVVIDSIITNPAGCDSDGGFASVVFFGDSANYIIEWTNMANPGVVISTDTTATNLRAGTYLLTISNLDGSCPTTAQVVIPTSTNLQPVYPFVFNTTCGRSNGRASVVPIGGTEPLQYLWTASDGRILSIDSVVTDLPHGSGYLLTVTDAAGCIYAYYFDIEDSFGPMFDLSPDTVIMAGGSAILEATNFNTQNYSISWSPTINLSCNTCETVVATPTFTITYALTMVDSNNCSFTDTVMVTVEGVEEGVYLPTAFTPNNDGLNDRLKINGVGVLRIDDWSIYSKSGALIYQVRNVPVINDDVYDNIAWDGRVNGSFVEPGSYVYTISVTFESNRTGYKSGSFTLIR